MVQSRKVIRWRTSMKRNFRSIILCKRKYKNSYSRTREDRQTGKLNRHCQRMDAVVYSPLVRSPGRVRNHRATPDHGPDDPWTFWTTIEDSWTRPDGSVDVDLPLVPNESITRHSVTAMLGWMYQKNKRPFSKSRSFKTNNGNRYRVSESPWITVQLSKRNEMQSSFRSKMYTRCRLFGIRSHDGSWSIYSDKFVFFNYVNFKTRSQSDRYKVDESSVYTNHGWQDRSRLYLVKVGISFKVTCCERISLIIRF